ncbi:MAG: condensation domain-containing protein, partial [Acidobacteriota bacterium]
AYLIKDLNPVRDTRRAAIINAGLTLHNFNPPASLQGELGFNISFLQQQIKTSEYDIWFLFGETRERIIGCINYNTDLFEVETIDLIWSRFVRILSEVTENQEIKIMDIELLSRTVAPAGVADIEIEFNF